MLFLFKTSNNIFSDIYEYYFYKKNDSTNIFISMFLL